MITPVQVAHTLVNGTFAALAAWSGDLILEVGASDQNTVDVEILPRWPSAFLVTAEPLIEKVARGMARRRPPNKVVDQSEPLASQHDRGIILPIAVGPTEDSGGEIQTFRVGGNAGCSSLANLSQTRASFGRWCRPTRDVRKVWTVPLGTLISHFPANSSISLLKIDAQGYDLKDFLSAGAAMWRLHHVSMEVVADDCRPVYADQPRCSEVVAEMRHHGFMPLGEVPCTPKFHRARYTHYCELEVVFKNAALGTRSIASSRLIYELHNLHFNGCSSLYTTRPADTLFSELTRPWYPDYVWPAVMGQTARKDNTSFGALYACPAACARGHKLVKSTRCPW